MVRRQRWWSVTKLAEIRTLGQAGDQFDATSTDLKTALLRLSPDERLPLVLHFYLDLPLEEVARTLGLSPAATKSRIYRTARKLRSDLTLEEVF
jgi:RNA polymerase sigma factor (sigma-70 family)